MGQSQLVKNVRCFTRAKKKTHLLCECDDAVVTSISYLIRKFLNEQLTIKKKSAVRKKLYPIRKYLRAIADKQVSTRRKREILINPKVGIDLHSAIKDTLAPALQKSLKEKKKKNKKNKKNKKKKKKKKKNS